MYIELLLTLLFLTTPAAAQSVSINIGKMWCVAKGDASNAALQASTDFACSMGADCTQIQPGMPCFDPETIMSHASYAMNSYYRNHGGTDSSCGFAGTGMLTSSDPSYGTCVYV